MIIKKFFAELLGTFILVFVGTGTAVLSGDGVGTTGIALAFGITIIASAYSIGNISGAHLNPAVSLAMLINKRLLFIEFLVYVLAQILGAFLGTGILAGILNGGNLPANSLGENTIKTTAFSAFFAEAILTLIFVLVIVTVTSKKFGHPNLAGIIIGLTLTMIHYVGVPLTGMSANPARSLAPAIFVGGTALQDLWVFIIAPLVGGVIAALIGQLLLETEEE
jgi:aquaporin Z